MRTFKFNWLVKKYSTNYELEIEPEAVLNKMTGKYEKGDAIAEYRRGVIVPYEERKIYQSGGVITAKDRLLISATPIDIEHSFVNYKNSRYKVESETPYDDYGDFYNYRLKHVSSFKGKVKADDEN